MGTADDQSPAIETDMMMSSSSAFSSHIKAISGTSRSVEHRPRGRFSKTSDNAYELPLPQGGRFGPPQVEDWPTEEQSRELVSIISNSIGNIQHLFDPRTFFDRLATVYDREDPGAWESDASTAEILMVLAVGKLLQGHIYNNEPFPGFNYYAEALKYISSLDCLHSAGVLGVEIMGLIAFYLQCADRKEDAYLYAGMGLRIAIVMGLHRDSSGASLTRSERVHRNRLWWTIYMQERRLAAATGNPPGIQDEAIRAPYPGEFPGFISPDALNVNINIAKATGQILQVIYGQKAQTERSFIKGVQGILVSLHQISGTIPHELELDFSDKPVTVTRTNATLYLMLYQAIMLATRPTLLYLTGKAVKGRNEQEILFQPLHQFAKTCIDAAQRSLAILRALRHQQLLANFGFFDLDAIFSVAFVFVLAGKIYPGKESYNRDIKLTLALLDHLSSHGNRAAPNRRADILQMCDHLGIAREQMAFSTHGERHPTRDPDKPPEHVQVADIPTETGPPQDTTTPLDFTEPALQWVNDIDELMLQQDPHDFYSLYYNDGFPLAGTVETDWEALERQIFR
ncbi:fungal specific transcription factor domain-containing protein [Aspergillus lucknowensis]|uniref:Xylanolytic transcriptional activator regulatory domain-containing protein n=1 Tax=Aspergillus lucknowensis TaxID=176173 RepID=A0ABR4LQ30_9EURO